MRTIARFVLLLILVLGAVSVAGNQLPVEAQGGLDLNTHCQAHGRVRATLVEENAYGWRCEDADGNFYDMSIQDACEEQYGSGYTAQYRDFSDPYSWYCEAPSSPSPDDGGGGGDQTSTDVWIESFEISPSSPVSWGTHLQLHGRAQGNVRAVRFEANGTPKAEIGQPEQWETIKTEEFPQGNLTLCFVVAENEWSTAARQCVDYWVGDNPPPVGNDDDSESGGGGGNGNESCPSYGSHLSVGMIVVVDVDQNGYLQVRSDPRLGGRELTRLYRGDQVTVVSGPQCHDGYRWWELGFSGNSGWAAEGDGGNYFLIPNGEQLSGDSGGNTNPGDGDSSSGGNTSSGGNNDNSGDTPQPQTGGDHWVAACTAPEPVSVGSNARIIHSPSSDPLNLRDEPALDGNILSRFVEGKIVSVIAGPICNDGYRWWQVNYNGTVGWLADGNSNSYWLEYTGSQDNSNPGGVNGGVAGSDMIVVRICDYEGFGAVINQFMAGSDYYLAMIILNAPSEFFENIEDWVDAVGNIVMSLNPPPATFRVEFLWDPSNGEYFMRLSNPGYSRTERLYHISKLHYEISQCARVS